MSATEQANDVKAALLSVCEKMTDLAGQGIKIEFAITDNKLVTFKAWQEMKVSS
jgi:hypothetical protein